MGRRYALVPHRPCPLDGCGPFRSYQGERTRQIQTQNLQFAACAAPRWSAPSCSKRLE
jgi:hypothetical protein